jgi:uncharacterized UPF0146 family protein
MKQVLRCATTVRAMSMIRVLSGELIARAFALTIYRVHVVHGSLVATPWVA